MGSLQLADYWSGASDVKADTSVVYIVSQYNLVTKSYLHWGSIGYVSV